MNKKIELILLTRKIISDLLIVGGRPVKRTTKKECYEALEKLQNLYKTNTIIGDEKFMKELEE